MSQATIIGLGLAGYLIGRALIKRSRFTKVTHFGGITIIKDKKTGLEYLLNSKGFTTKL